jgi:hypothetical protein
MTMIQNTDGEAMELLTATFACAEGMDVGAALARLPNVEAEGDDVWNWVEPRKGSSDSDGAWCSVRAHRRPTLTDASGLASRTFDDRRARCC